MKVQLGVVHLLFEPTIIVTVATLTSIFAL